MYISDVRALATEILHEGRMKFDSMIGIVSHIYDGTYEVFAVNSVTGTPQVGEKFGLRAVYCREVYEKRKTIALAEIKGIPGLRLHPLYTLIPCEVYISSPIIIDGSVWGTLNYTSMIIRDTPFSLEDVQYNEDQAARIATAISNAKLE